MILWDQIKKCTYKFTCKYDSLVDFTYKPTVSSSKDSNATESLPVVYIATILVGIGILLIAAVGLAFYLWKQKKRETNASPEIGASDDSILSNRSSELGEVNFFNKQNLSKDDDLEVDSPLLKGGSKEQRHSAKGPRPELMSNLPSSGPGKKTWYGIYEESYTRFIVSSTDCLYKMLFTIRFNLLALSV